MQFTHSFTLAAAPLLALGMTSSTAYADDTTPPAAASPAPAADTEPAATSVSASRSSTVNPAPTLGAPVGVDPARDQGTRSGDSTDASHDVRGDIPIVAYAYSAAGVPVKTYGASVFGLGIGASGQAMLIGGGVTFWGSPIAGLTLIGDASRNVYGEFSPSLGAAFRLYGNASQGLTVGVLGRYKVDGFGRGPQKDEMEGEIEGGLLIGYAESGYRLDANLVSGFGTTEDGEIDIEARLRAARDVGRYVRVGLDGQFRARVAGPLVLANGRSVDWVIGPQVLVGSNHVFGTLTAGPTTTGTLSRNVGAVAIVSVGGTTF